MLGLPWGRRKRLAETDGLLMMALAAHRAGLCPCGCGQHSQLAHDKSVEWEPHVVQCYAGAAKAAYEKDRGDDLPSGALIVMRAVNSVAARSELEATLERRRRPGRRVVR